MSRFYPVLLLALALVPAADRASQAKVAGPQAAVAQREPARRHKDSRRFWMPGASRWMAAPSPIASAR